MSPPRTCPNCGRPCNLLLKLVEDGRLLCVRCYGLLMRERARAVLPPKDCASVPFPLSSWGGRGNPMSASCARKCIKVFVRGNPMDAHLFG